MALPRKYITDLYDLFAQIENREEARMLLEDILTPHELASVAERWQLIQELEKGTPQRDIAAKLGLSISKITRGSRMLQYGNGGFRLFLEKKNKGK